MTNTSWLPRFLRWIFTVFMVFMGIAAVALVVVMVIDPKLPAGTQIGPMAVKIMGEPGTITLQNANFDAVMLRGGLNVRVENAAGLIEVLKQYGLPLALLNVLFFAALFDFLRRLFRNVGRGESFTRQNVRLVQIIGFSLIGFSLLSAVAEGWFQYEVYDYLARHAMIVISGTPIHLPHSDNFTFSSGGGSPFGSPYFFTGMLVLALSEVFRQGLALKSENDLTV
jgi:hypothetical protein